MTERVYVVGVGMTKFEKPGSRDWDYPDMAKEAGLAALADAGISYDQVQQAFVGFAVGDSTSGQRALYELGMTGIPVINVNNNCATGSSALYLARGFVKGGQADCVLALGFEKMKRGSLDVSFTDRTSPMEPFFGAMRAKRGVLDVPPTAQLFGSAGLEYMERYGVTRETFAKIAEKNHRHSVNNPNAQFQDQFTLQEILDSPMVFDPLTRLQCSPTSDGGAAAIVVSERFMREHNLQDRAVEIAGQGMATDVPAAFNGSDMSLVGMDMTVMASRKAYEESGLGPEDAQVIELHDCFSTNELITYEGLGLCSEGKAGQLVDEGAVDYGGTWVVNPSGGLIAKGHPLGATGLAQCAEMVWQLRGTAGARQVNDATVGIAHNLGIGGAAVVSVFRAL